MKTYNNLFEKITDINNIRCAIVGASKGKRKNKSVQKALNNFYATADKIQKLLVSGQWKPQEVHRIKVINDGIQMKKREIVCPQFVNEQVVHHAIMRVLLPEVINKKLYCYCCGSVKGKGDEVILKYLTKKIKRDPRHTKYYVKMDIKKFFDSIRPSVVFRIYRTMIRDKKTLFLLAKLLRGNKVLRPDGTIIKRGSPIGFYTSPINANIVLTPLDHCLKDKNRISVVVRYMDDILMMDGNKRKLKHAIADVYAILEKLHLQLKNKPQIHRLDKVPLEFIGFQFSRHKVILRSPCFLRAVRSIARTSRKPKLTTYDCERILCYVSRFVRVDTKRAYKKYIKPYVVVKQLKIQISMKARLRNGLALQRKHNKTQVGGKNRNRNVVCPQEH